MKFSILLYTALVAISAAAPVAASNDDQGARPMMPMMNQGNYGQMMTPEQLQQMQEMMSSGQYQQMPMMTPEQLQQMQEMMSSGQLPQMPMMNPQMMMYGMHPMGYPYAQYAYPGMAMMNPQVMQMRMLQMANMEKSLQRIEALLEELVELQKAQ